MTEKPCEKCGGTGKRFAWRSEVDPRYIGPCEPCFGTGRVVVSEVKEP